MPLQNRVAPDGSLHAVPERGTMLGNRGGKFHRDDKTLGQRRWATHHWICCELNYKGMHHEAMGRGYTSLFFLDEVTALAAGHRPCFFCRRKEAKAFLNGESVESFDRRVHGERMDLISHSFAVTASPKEKRQTPVANSPGEKRQAGLVPSPLEKVPSASEADEVPYPTGIMLTDGASFFALRNNHLLRWSFGGYTDAFPVNPAMRMKLLTPPSITAILRAGYKPRWHPSATQWDNTT